MAYQLGYVYAARGDPAQALVWLERALRLRDAGLLAIASDPLLANLADNADFKAFMSKLMLPA